MTHKDGFSNKFSFIKYLICVLFYFLLITLNLFFEKIHKDMFLRILKQYFLALLPLLIFSTTLESQTPGELQLVKLKERVEVLNTLPILKNAAWGFSAVDVAGSEIIFEHNGKIGLIPASALKAVTTAAALSILGENFRFNTVLQYSGNVDSVGTLKGNLFIKGGGDPSFCSDIIKETSSENVFSLFLDAINKTGIKRIEGNIIGDESVFEWNRVPGSWAWEDVGNYYGAGPCGLSFNNNQYKIFFNPGGVINSNADFLGIKPVIPGLSFVNKVTTASSGSGDQVVVFCSPWSDTCYLTGTVPLGKKNFEVKGAIPDPAYACAVIFTNYLKDKGFEISGMPTTSRIIDFYGDADTSKRYDIMTITSPDMSTIINHINTKSDNTYSEALLNMCGLKTFNKGNTKSGVKAITAFWKGKGVNTDGFSMDDGSGLSRKNYINTSQLAGMLAVYKKEKSYLTFYNSLSVAGKNGTVRNMFKGTFAENNLRAKSGTMSGIRSYVGYLRNQSGKDLAFAVIVNNYNGTPKDIRVILEEILILLAGT